MLIFLIHHLEVILRIYLLEKTLFLYGSTRLYGQLAFKSDCWSLCHWLWHFFFLRCTGIFLDSCSFMILLFLVLLDILKVTLCHLRCLLWNYFCLLDSLLFLRHASLGASKKHLNCLRVLHDYLAITLGALSLL